MFRPDVSQVEVEGAIFNSRIAGGVLADGLNCVLAALCTVTVTTTFAQNSVSITLMIRTKLTRCADGVISLTQMASRYAGYACCFWLLCKSRTSASIRLVLMSFQ